MSNPTEYVKLRVLAAIDLAEGRSIRDRIRAVAQRVFVDEQGGEHRFTWRTIETWRLRYNRHGFRVSGGRRDKGKFRKVEPEAVQEEIDQARAQLRAPYRLSQLYRVCIERGLLRRDLVAPNTFRRIVRRYEMLKPDADTQSRSGCVLRSALPIRCGKRTRWWGPFVTEGDHPARPARLIAFLDDASRVCCHGQFFFEENAAAFKTALLAADNTFSFEGRRYEAPRDVRSREIVVRYDPGNEEAPLVVYLGADRLGEARALNPILNDRAPRRGAKESDGAGESGPPVPVPPPVVPTVPALSPSPALSRP